MFSRFNTIPACDGQTSCNSIFRAMHTRRAVIKLSDIAPWNNTLIDDNDDDDDAADVFSH